MGNLIFCSLHAKPSLSGFLVPVLAVRDYKQSRKLLTVNLVPFLASTLYRQSTLSLKGTADWSRCIIAPWYYLFLTTQSSVCCQIEAVMQGQTLLDAEPISASLCVKCCQCNLQQRFVGVQYHGQQHWFEWLMHTHRVWTQTKQVGQVQGDYQLAFCQLCCAIPMWPLANCIFSSCYLLSQLNWSCKGCCCHQLERKLLWAQGHPQPETLIHHPFFIHDGAFWELWCSFKKKKTLQLISCRAILLDYKC